MGGLCAAIALRHAGLEVAVYERAEAYRPLGAGLSLWPNAMRAFERLGLAREVVGAGATWRETVMHRWDGKVLSRLAVEVLCREVGQPTGGVAPPRWGEGPVSLLGDAAHAMVTDMGQGACQAIEDALVLAKLLREDSDRVRALRTYEARRQPRTAYISELSLRAGALRYLRNPVARWGRDLLMQALPSSVALDQLRRVVGYDFLAWTIPGPAAVTCLEGRRPDTRQQECDSRTFPGNVLHEIGP